MGGVRRPPQGGGGRAGGFGPNPLNESATCATGGRVAARGVRGGRPGRPGEEGGKWADADGRHVLIRRPAGVHELLLRADTLMWELRELPGVRRPA